MEIKMKARIRKDSGGCYIGEIYGDWSNLLLGTKWTGWNDVTSRCMTKFGARLELDRWKKENCPKEFEI